MRARNANVFFFFLGSNFDEFGKLFSEYISLRHIVYTLFYGKRKDLYIAESTRGKEHVENHAAMIDRRAVPGERASRAVNARFSEISRDTFRPFLLLVSARRDKLSYICCNKSRCRRATLIFKRIKYVLQ